MKHIVIIGGGITGLATAFYLQQYAGAATETTLIESSSRLGGKILSAHQDGFTIECGPDSFITQKPAAITLCRDLGLADQLIGSSIGKPTYVWSRGALHPLPEGMMLMAPTMMLPFLRSRLISWRGKLRMGMELLIPRREEEGDESLASFTRRRLGAEALEKIAAPLMAGIFAADPEKLGLQTTFPMFLEMEKQHGSLLRGILKRNRAKARNPVPAGSEPKPSPMFMTLRGGLEQLVDALVARLKQETVLLNRKVVCVNRVLDRYQIDLNDGARLWADEIVFATPADVTADLVRGLDPVLAFKLRGIRYVSTATVSLAFKHSDLKAPLNGTGFLVPHSARRRITACSWSSQKFSHRAPDDCELIRVFIGGARAEFLAEQDEAALIQIAREELLTIMGIDAEPVLAKAYRWSKANPQYDVGHGNRVAEVEHIASWHPGLHLAGAAYHGAGIPDCISSGMKIASKIANSLTNPEPVDEPAPLAAYVPRKEKMTYDIRRYSNARYHDTPAVPSALGPRLLKESHAGVLGDDAGLRPGLPPLSRRGRF
ncbi:MAG TPA: protoporphyrinogen oxidase [Acidobacteriaceae bacterium]|nr:protoporphyrinogen oxidase [Acidobacteriaceae bacterium]